MTLEERANAIAACRNGVVPGSHLHKRLTAYAVQMLSEVRDEAIEECAKVAGCYKRDASFDHSIVGALEHPSNQQNIAAAILALKGRP